MFEKTSLGGFAFILALTVILGGCGAPSPSPPSSYYILSPLSDMKAEAPPSSAEKKITLAVGPVVIPKHLDRSQIVKRTSRHQLVLASLDQWAEPLKDNFTRVLVENLSSLLGTDRVETYPWHRSITVDYQVVVEVIRFDANSMGKSILIARWKVFGNNGREFLFSRRSEFSKQVTEKDLESVVETMSGNLGELSNEIAAALIAL